MSYILDALKKAEAERHGGPRAAGPVPPSFHVHARREPLWRRPWLWSVLTAAAVVAGGLFWLGGAPSSSPQEPAQASQDVRPAPAASAAPSAPSAPSAPAAPSTSSPPVAQAPASPAPATPPSPAPAAPTPPLAQAPAKAPEPPAEKPRTAERKPAERKTPEGAKPAGKPQQEDAKAAAAPTAPEKPRPAPEPPVGTLRDLPAQIQQEVPQYSVGGYIYSANKADRSVLINKRLLREGDEIAPGLKLETMTPSGMILNYKGYRYRASY